MAGPAFLKSRDVGSSLPSCAAWGESFNLCRLQFLVCSRCEEPCPSRPSGRTRHHQDGPPSRSAQPDNVSRLPSRVSRAPASPSEPWMRGGGAVYSSGLRFVAAGLPCARLQVFTSQIAVRTQNRHCEQPDLSAAPRP